MTVTVEEGASGSLSLFYKPGFQCGIGFDGDHVFAFRGSYKTEHRMISSDTVTLRLLNDRHEVDLFYRVNNREWCKLDHSFEMSGFHNNVLGSFLSLRIALDVVGEGTAWFSNFIYAKLD